MNKSIRLIIAGSLIIIIALGSYNFYMSNQERKFITELMNYRSERDIWYGSNFDSPFLKYNVPFHRIDYFEPNMDLVVTAEFSRNYSSDSVKLTTSTGDMQSYLVYGEANFTLDNIENSLLLLFLPGDAKLFLPFMDATSGNTTYGAGRYLEVSLPHENKVILDFNRAYNPYCAYTEGYTCPFPPKANVLKVAIEAGEKSYH